MLDSPGTIKTGSLYHMIRASLILTLAGGVFGLFFSVPGIVVGAQHMAAGTEGGAIILTGSIALSALCGLAILAKMFPRKAPAAPWIIAILTSISGFVLLGFLWFPPGIVLIGGAVTDRIAARENTNG